MNAKEFINVMKQASDFPKGMERLIVKYGEMLLEESKSQLPKLTDIEVVEFAQKNSISKLTEREKILIRLIKHFIEEKLK
jgi:UDP-N-acetylglucosamine transferase subunit ALG13